MFNHADIWNAIDRLAQEKGTSPSGLAKLAGLDPTTFNKSKRVTPSGRLRWPSTESISKILLITHTPLAEFTSYLTGQAMAEHFLTIPALDEKTALKTKLENTRQSVSFPASSHQNLISFEIISHDFEPLYQSGDVLIVDTNAQLRRGDKILLKSKKSKIIFGYLKRDTANALSLDSSANQNTEQNFEKNDIEWFGRILWVSQ